MIIECPSCLTRFNVPDEAILLNGRTVKCAKCQNKWHANPPVEEPKPIEEEHEVMAEEPEIEGEDDEVEEIIEEEAEEGDLEEEFLNGEDENYSGSMQKTLAAIRAEQTEDSNDDSLDGDHPVEEGNKKSSLKLAGWAALLVFILGFGIVFGFFQSSLTDAWPPANKLYSLIGIKEAIQHAPIGVVSTELKINPSKYISMAIEAKYEADADGSNVLIVFGNIISSADFKITLPKAKGILRDEGGNAIHEWFFNIPQGEIEGGTAIPFETRILRAPSQTRNIETDFMWP